LKDGEEVVGKGVLHLRSDDDDASADIEPADLVDGQQHASCANSRARSVFGYVAFNRAILASLVCSRHVLAGSSERREGESGDTPTQQAQVAGFVPEM
jgi:hypothetical protein